MGLDIAGIGSVLDFGSKIIDKIWPDPAKAAEAKLALFTAQQAGEFKEMDQIFELAKGQIGVNTEEAKSTNWFVAAWRPFVGWVCGVGLAYVAIVEPVARFVASVWFGYVGEFPVIDTSLTMQVLLGMLGLGAMRTFEKHGGSENKR